MVVVAAVVAIPLYTDMTCTIISIAGITVGTDHTLVIGADPTLTRGCAKARQTFLAAARIEFAVGIAIPDRTITITYTWPAEIVGANRFRKSAIRKYILFRTLRFYAYP